MAGKKILDRRYVARVILEAETPLKIGTGAVDFFTDSPVFTDADGLPQIPGSSLCGVLHHSLPLDDEMKKAIFGFSGGPQTDRSKAEDDEDAPGLGSRLIFSSACLLLDGNKVAQGLLPEEILKDDILKNITKYPLREHCRINEKGAADTENRGKFDEALVPRGLRFIFEMELLSSLEEADDFGLWDTLIDQLKSSQFRLGGGVRRGFGKMRVEEIATRIYNLRDAGERREYLDRTSSMEDDLKGFDKKKNLVSVLPGGWIKYELELKPVSTWIFSAGYRNSRNNTHSAKEISFHWDENKIKYRLTPCGEGENGSYLIPASSVKGALAHRTAYHYNKNNDRMISVEELLRKKKKEQDQFIEKQKCLINENTGENNKAVWTLFGTASSSRDNKTGSPGVVYFRDIYLSPEEGAEIKVFDHTAIDRFTGGARISALFSEEVLFSPEKVIKMEILVDYRKRDDDILLAFEQALTDLCRGKLPLGGNVMRGHGCFKGTMKRTPQKEVI